MARKKTAVEKRDQAPAPEVQVLTESKGLQCPPGRMLIASPLAVAATVEQVPAGSVLTMPELRARLAREFDADYACPLTTGIFLRIVIDAAREEDSDLPFWRIVSSDGKMLGKRPGEAEAQAKRLMSEGVACRPAGANNWRVTVPKS